MINNNQNNIIFKSMDLQRKLEDRRVFDQFLNQTQHVTCDKPKGRLVKETPLQSFKAVFTDTAKDISNLGKALTTGKSNDHELGKMNDIGMKMGGGLVAAALMGARSTNAKKLMEVIGFGTFFTSMALWPKLAIDLPTKLKYGFNPHQKYIDSQGRKKEFFQDNQYLPWDVWSKEDINKVADKMGIPKNIKDREQFTKEKMRTIALQDNTLWMLTAGFATPLLTSLICNRIEEGIKVPVANRDLKKLHSQFSPLSSEADYMGGLIEKTVANPNVFQNQDEEFGALIEELHSGKMPADFAQRLGKIFNLSSVTTNPLISENLRKNGVDCADDLIKKLFLDSPEFLNNGFIEKLIGDVPENAQEIESAKNLFRQAYNMAKSDPDLAGRVDMDDILKNVFSLARKENKEWAKPLRFGTEGLSDELKLLAKAESLQSKETLSSGADVLSNIYNETIKPAQAQMRILGDKIKVLDGISGEEYNRVLKSTIKLLGFSDSEITLLRNSTEDFGPEFQEFVTNKIKNIAQNEKDYQSVIAKLEKIQESVDSTNIKGTKTTIGDVFNTMITKVNTILKGLSNISSSQSEAYSNSSLNTLIGGGLNRNEIGAARSNITSVESVITRMYNAIILERSIQDGTFKQNWARYAIENGLEGNIDDLGSEELEKFYSLCRKIAWQSSYGDAMNKHYVDGNGSFFKTLTDAIFHTSSDKDNVKNWVERARSISNECDYIPLPSHTMRLEGEGAEYIGEMTKSHGLKFADFGESVLGAFKKQINQMYNDRTWMKVFGGLTVVLLGATFISKMFFGKVKNAQLYEKQEQVNSFEGGKN